ncbi:hypothetical protein V8V91_14500 [Algoriphagus halophilus]|uniref:hypothetical protein n=1 Tax=Algoriphagus halophilus TaxID=226505 RepID=UPI00358FE452
MQKLLTLAKGIVIVFLLASNFTYAQSVKLEQGQNGGVDKEATSPVIWSTGNSNSGNSHFLKANPFPIVLPFPN